MAMNPVRVWFLKIFQMAAIAGFVSLLGLSPARAQATVSQQQLLTATRIAKGSWQYTYQVTVQNGPLALDAVTIVATDSSPNGTVLQNSAGLGNLAANATVSASVTFQATSSQPGSNGDYHDSFWSNYLSRLLFEVIPGPGPVAQATISSAQGGTIKVTGAGNPLNGTTVVIPPGALADPTDTITIGYSNVLPSPLNATATAAGIITVSPVLTLDRTGTSSLTQDIVVTVPYNARALNPNDFPAVIYWDSSLAQWQPIQVTGVDPIAGNVTFVTKHFSDFNALGLPELSNILQGIIPWPSILAPIDTGFRPATDGFEVENFSTQYIDPSGSVNEGNCYGMTAYAAWFFQYKPSPLQGLFAHYQVPGNRHIPQQDAVARELIHRTWVLTTAENDATTSHELNSLNLPNSALLTASNLVLELEATNAPQLVGVYQKLTSGQLNVGGHSVIAYSWNFMSSGPPGLIQFSIYDPNFPGVAGSPIVWTPGAGFALFTSGSDTYPYIAFDAVSSHFDLETLDLVFTNGEQGWPVRASFNNLAITAPTPVSPISYPSVGTYQINATGQTNISVTWNCTPSAASLQDNCGTSYAHIFQDSAPLGNALPFGPGGTIQIPISPLQKPMSELLVIVSKDSGNSRNQDDISNGYDAFLRADLVPPPTTNQVLIDVQFSGTFSYCTTCAQSNPPQSGAALVGKAGDKWNDFHTTSVSGAPLVDASGASTGVTLSFSSFGAYTADPSYDPFTGSLDANLIQGYLYSGGSINITLSGLTPNQSYTLYVYTQGDNNSPGRSIAISANGTTQSATQSNAHNFILNNNYVAETVTADGSGNIRIQGVTLAGEGDINGLQLVSGPQILPEQDFLVTATETCSGGLGNFCKLFPVSWQFTVQIIGPNSSGNYLVTDVSEDVSYNGPLPFTATSTPSGCCVTYTTGGVAGTFVTPITNGVVTETLVSTEEP
jgi:hypothetical protein